MERNQNSSSDSHETVLLETLDGQEFIKLCARIFEKLGYGTVEIMPYTGNVRGDLLIHAPDGLIVVECKHPTHTSIGRPVVQKLHSSVVSSNAIKGFLITSGKFSAPAIEYANILSPKIEMVDKKILTDLATRSGIEFIVEGKRSAVLRYSFSEADNVRNKTISFIEGKCESNPKNVSDLSTISHRSVAFLPAYRVQYNVDSTFETTIGVIHEEHLKDGVILVDGNSGSRLKQEIAEHLTSSPLCQYNESDFSQISFTRPDFVIDERTLETLSKKIIIEQHTRRISYYGNNHHSYSKICTPREKDVFLSDIKQVYLPYQEIQFNILAQNYELKGVENPQKMLVYTTMMNCKICGKYIDSNGIVCNSCGSLVHGPQILDSHGFSCKICGKTICRNCAYTLGFNNIVCKECAEKSGKPLIHVPDKMNQRTLAGGSCIFLGLIFLLMNFILFLILMIIGIVILASDYRARTPPFELI
jgi:restriction system protein